MQDRQQLSQWTSLAATAKEASAILSILFASFPGDGLDEEGRTNRVKAYLMAVDGYSVDVLKWVVGTIIRGDYASVDKRFMPTPPQVREICDARHSELWRAAHPAPQPDYSRFEYEPSPEEVVRVKQRIEGAKAKIDAGGGFPSPDEFRRWNLPTGTIIVAADATLIYPNGATESWGDIRRRHARERAEAV